MLLEIDGLECAVPGRTLFSGLNLSIDRGERVAIVGRSGSGKSTLIRAIMGLHPVKQGDIRILGKSMAHASLNEREQLRRRHIGLVHQDGELIDELTAVENVVLALLLTEKPPADAKQIAQRSIRSAGVPENTVVAQLSGGERQRTALVRALVTAPDLILADEPTGSLDTTTRDHMADELFRVVREHDLGLILVTHDIEVAKRADRIVRIGDE